MTKNDPRPQLPSQRRPSGLAGRSQATSTPSWWEQRRHRRAIARAFQIRRDRSVANTLLAAGHESNEARGGDRAASAAAAARRVKASGQKGSKSSGGGGVGSV